MIFPFPLTLLHSQTLNLHRVLAFVSAIWFNNKLEIFFHKMHLYEQCDHLTYTISYGQAHYMIYSYFMPVCSIVKTITRGAVTILQTSMK